MRLLTAESVVVFFLLCVYTIENSGGKKAFLLAASCTQEMKHDGLQAQKPDRSDKQCCLHNGAQ